MPYPGQPKFSDFRAPILPSTLDDPKRKLRVVCIGAGVSGITAGIRIPQKLGKHVDLQIYEKNPDVGGTWYENRYPGVACDIPAVSYQWTFESWPKWNKYYADGKQIHEYLQFTAEKYKVLKYIKLDHKVVGATWQEGKGTWSLRILDIKANKEFEDYCDVLLLGYGILNVWKWPKIQGIHSFKGEYMHTAHFDESFDATGKSVALIGGGATGIQILPEIRKQAKTVDHYMRSANWAAPVGFGAAELEKRGTLKEGNFAYTSEEISTFTKDPSALHQHRLEVEDALANFVTPEVMTFGSPIQTQFADMFKQHMSSQLETKPHILKTLLPEYPPGCRRLTPGPGYLDALTKPNVDFISDNIARITEDGILTEDGKLRKVDAIIYATGFDAEFRSRFPTIGRDGITWDEVMTPEPESYLGTLIDKMPNAFLFFGPNVAPGGTSGFLLIESQMEYMISMIKKMLDQKIKSFCIKTERVKQYTQHVFKWMETTIFGQPCPGWIKRNELLGRNIAFYCGNALHHQVLLRQPRWEDYDWTYPDEFEGNPLAFLGDGYTTADYKSAHPRERIRYIATENIDYPPIPCE